MCPLPSEIKVWVVAWSCFINNSWSGACGLIFILVNIEGQKAHAWMFRNCDSRIYTMEQDIKNVRKNSLLVQIKSLNAAHNT